MKVTLALLLVAASAFAQADEWLEIVNRMNEKRQLTESEVIERNMRTPLSVPPLSIPPVPPGVVAGQAYRLSAQVPAAIPIPQLTGNKKVLLQFDPSTDPVDGYKIHYRTDAAGGQTNTVDIGLQLSTIIATLLPDALYHFHATAYSGPDESIPSNEVSYRTPANTAVIVRHFGPTPTGPWTRMMTNRIWPTNATEYYMHTITIE